MEYDDIIYEKSAGTAVITINRPSVYNAFRPKTVIELLDAFQDAGWDRDIGCIVLTGTGDKAFCTGMDVGDVAEGTAREDAQRIEEETGKAFFHYLTAIHNEVWKPVITAVNGMVVGGGLHFIADSDLIVCAENATFFDTHVKVGLIAGLEPVGLARRIPLEAVLRMALLGGSERMTAQEALAIGLVGEVVPPEELMPRARELASKISEHSPTALARSKRAIWQSLDEGLSPALEKTWQLIQEHTGHPDLEEGTQAFVEKRKPRWAPYTGE